MIDWSAFGELPGEGAGCVVGVATADRVTWRSFGRESPDGHPLTASTPIYVASVAKQFTAAVVAGLVMDGAISLLSPVRTLLPELPASWDLVEVGHLVTHTAGLAVRDVDEREELAATVQERITALAATSPGDGPGQVHRYSNDGYVLLADVAQRATGVGLGELAHRRLFEPAGMVGSHFADTAGPWTVPGWADGRRQVDLEVRTAGGGGLISSVDDLLTWSRWLPRQPLAPVMLAGRPTVANGRWGHDASGISIRTHHGRLIHSHGGSVSGYLASTIRFPELDTSFVVLANSDRGGIGGVQQRLHRFIDALLAAHLDLDQPSLEHTHGAPLD